MKIIKLILLKFTLLFLLNNYLYSQLYINEVIPTNDAILADNYGEYDDVIEIYNAGANAVNLAGYYLSDDSGDPTQWQIPATNASLTTVPAAQGANHLNFKLSGGGESIILTTPDGVTTVDAITFSAVITDYGYGRLPDGSANLSELTPASPTTTNNNSQPKVATPVVSLPSGLYNGTQTVSITAESGAVLQIVLWRLIPI